MKKYLSILLLCFISLIMLTGCESQEEQSKDFINSFINATYDYHTGKISREDLSTYYENNTLFLEGNQDVINKLPQQVRDKYLQPSFDQTYTYELSEVEIACIDDEGFKFKVSYNLTVKDQSGEFAKYDIYTLIDGKFAGSNGEYNQIAIQDTIELVKKDGKLYITLIE